MLEKRTIRNSREGKLVWNYYVLLLSIAESNTFTVFIVGYSENYSQSCLILFGIKGNPYDDSFLLTSSSPSPINTYPLKTIPDIGYSSFYRCYFRIFCIIIDIYCLLQIAKQFLFMILTLFKNNL
jgi:hypothetical protein